MGGGCNASTHSIEKGSERSSPAKRKCAKKKAETKMFINLCEERAIKHTREKRFVLALFGIFLQARKIASTNI